MRSHRSGSTPQDDAIEADALSQIRDSADPGNVEPLEPLTKLLREFGLSASPATCWRWITKGRRGVRLQIVRAGKLLSKRSWLQAFVDAALTENTPEAPPVTTPRQLEARHRRNLAELAKP